MRIAKLLVASIGLSVASLSMAQSMPSANEVFQGALSKAKSGQKAVFVSFHASWCGWCHKLEDFLAIPEVKSIWNKRVETVWLTVLESQDKKNLENPGAEELLAKLGGKDQGIPYFAFYDSKGKMLVTSNRPADSKIAKDKGGNTGYPAAPEEINWFIHMLEVGVKNMTAAERSTIKSLLEKEAKKIGH